VVALTSERFEALLSALDPDRDEAGERYETLRLKLVKYFELRMCHDPDDRTDEVIDRVARRLSEGERVQAPALMQYVYGVARNVMLEYWKSQRRQKTSVALAEDHPESALDRIAADLQLACFQGCLGEQPEDARSLLLEYFQFTGRTRIDVRLSLARRLGIPLNALRIRIHRLKNDLHRCMENCIRKGRS
jgi:DNA-directed RNA polymerase specialized sigma24 family protein